jgi:hypothetical protein
MIITTTQEYALVAACCPCSIPVCEAPRKQCQSITIDACGESLPDLESVPSEDKCKLFKKIEFKYSALVIDENVRSGDQTLNGSQYVESSCTINKVFETIDDSRECSDENVTDLIITDSITYTYTSTGEPASSLTVNGSGSGTSETWTGSVSGTTTSGDGDPEPFGPDPIEYPGCDTFLVDNDFTYSEFVFTEILISINPSIITVPNPDEDPENPDDDFIEEQVGQTTSTDTFTVTYSEPVELADLEAEFEATKALLAENDDPWPGSECNSFTEYSYAYPEPDPEAPEPDPEMPVEEVAPVCTQISSMTKARYRMGIPSSSRWDAVTAEWIAWDEGGREGEEPEKTSFDVAHAAWVIAKAAWDVADPETRGPEPIEPTKRTFFQIQWDEVQFPADWDAWRSLKDAFDIATAAHEAWEAEDPKSGPEPEVPEDPGDAPTPGPTVIASRSWSYAGADDFSPWYELEVMEVEGETRVVNVMTKCYQSARLGSLPTAHGEIYESE